MAGMDIRKNKHGASHHMDDENSEDHWNCVHRKAGDLETCVQKNSFVACSWKVRTVEDSAVDVLVRSDSVSGAQGKNEKV